MQICSRNIGNKGKNKKRNPEQEYVFEPILRKREKEGIDMVTY